jgi:transposase
LTGKPGDSGRTEKDNRLFVDSVLWILRSGARWFEMPEDMIDSTLDFDQALLLLKSETPQYVLADKGYDSDKIVAYIKQISATLVIPPRSNRIIKRPYDSCNRGFCFIA